MRDKITGFPTSDYNVFNSHDEGVKFFLTENVVILLAFSFLTGAEKSMSDIGAKGTVLYDGGSQEHGNDVHDIDFLACMLASSANKIAAV